MTYRAIDVMGFAGGFTLGVVQAGFTLVGKRELRGGFGVPNCEANRHLLGDTWVTEIGDARTWTVPRGGADLVFGNPPCSGFSVMSTSDFRGADSPVNSCMWAFVEYVARVRPKIAIFESVQAARTRTDGHDLMRRLRTHLETLTGEAWDLHHVRHNAIAVGGAAERRRYFWIVSRIPFGVSEPDIQHVPQLRDVIGDLADLTLTWHAQPYRSPASSWASAYRRTAVDGMMMVDNPGTRRVMALLAATDWRKGEHIAVVARRHHDTHGRLPDNWAHLTDRLVERDFAMGFTTPVRWRADAPARVITGGALLTVVHPWLPRMITHRETARIMGFPDDWLIEPLRGVIGNGMTWGKGITVDCGRWIARVARRALEGEPQRNVGELIGLREWDVNLTNTHKRRGLVQ